MAFSERISRLKSSLIREILAAAQRPEVIALSKADITEVRDEYERLKAAFAERGKHLYLISAATRDGVAEVLEQLTQVLRAERAANSSAK